MKEQLRPGLKRTTGYAEVAQVRRRSGAIGEPTRLWVLVLSSRQDGEIWIVMFIACWTFYGGWRVRPSSVLQARAEAVSHDERHLDYAIDLKNQGDNALLHILLPEWLTARRSCWSESRFD
ncbi:hypothetical protein RHIZ404_220892 [Rhizobium sp. EC-SD404]|nr:hypothetical protein RHIZ404_220892 [Rhizobium sp. EC-SD404]